MTPSFFTKKLLEWNKKQNNRSMPWKGEKDPYKIWLSEIILQQTRVEQGLAYYERFIKKFPTVHQLAQASEKSVFKLWEGLGYYTRCRNLHATAKFISQELKGKFPNDYESIKSLKGIGPYTASAIASFAFNLPYAVVDGNVYRVLARVFGIKTPIDSTTGKTEFVILAEKLLDKKNPGLYNQAIMDFGATVCKPALPNCKNCIFKNNCVAYRNNTVSLLPIKEKKIAVQKRYFSFLILSYKKRIAIHQQNTKDIWQGLYLFPFVETKKEKSIDTVLKQAEKELLLIPKSYELTANSETIEQRLTHQIIYARFVHLRLDRTPLKNKKLLWLPKNRLAEFAFPKIIGQYLKQQLEKV